MNEQEKSIHQEAEQIVEKIRELVKKGNVSRITIKKGGETIVNLPVNVGVLGAVVGVTAAPWAMLIAAITTVGLDCTVELLKTDGTVVDIKEKAVTVGEKVAETGAVIMEDMANEIRESVQKSKQPKGDG